MTHRDPAPLTAHPREALRAGADLFALDALAVVGQVSLLKVMGGAVARRLLRGLLIESGALHAIGHRKLHAHDMEVVVADFTADGHHVLHLFPTDVAELALFHHGPVRPVVRHGILKNAAEKQQQRERERVKQYLML